MNTILPIGSVVMLNNATKPVMIFGYLQKSNLTKNEVVDYVGVPYPEGNINVAVQIGFPQRDAQPRTFTSPHSFSRSGKFWNVSQ